MAPDAGLCRVALVGNPDHLRSQLDTLAIPADAVQGLAKAGLDLSRGSSASEIVKVMAVAVLRATARETE